MLYFLFYFLQPKRISKGKKPIIRDFGNLREILKNGFVLKTVNLFINYSKWKPNKKYHKKILENLWIFLIKLLLITTLLNSAYQDCQIVFAEFLINVFAVIELDELHENKHHFHDSLSLGLSKGFPVSVFAIFQYNLGLFPRIF